MSSIETANRILPWVHISGRDAAGRPNAFVVPARDGEYAAVSLTADDTKRNIHCFCRHYKCRQDGDRCGTACPAAKSGAFCYHILAALLRAAADGKVAVRFFRDARAAESIRREIGGEGWALWIKEDGETLYAVFSPADVRPANEQAPPSADDNQNAPPAVPPPPADERLAHLLHITETTDGRVTDLALTAFRIEKALAEVLAAVKPADSKPAPTRKRKAKA